MHAVVTGLSGTLAPYVRNAVEGRGGRVTGWDRAAVSPDDPDACRAFLDNARPDAVFHLAMGGEDWAAQLARWCDRHDARFVFTSTAMIFANRPDGPHRAADPRTADEDYGRYKMRCEDAVLEASTSAVVARIGWQIGEARGGNHMVEHLWKQHEVDGVLRPSRRWRPACSFMTDTAEALLALLDHGEPGLFHVDANANADDGRGMTFDQIVHGLNRKLDAGWRVEPNGDFIRDQRLLDDRIRMPTMSERLG